MCIARINFSPGQYRDLSKPLVEVDPAAPPRIQREQRFARATVRLIVGLVLAMGALLALLLVMALVVAVL